MPNILYMAISEDGYIADLNDNTAWSDDAWKAFKDFVTSCDVVLLGRRTFQIMQKSDEFVEGPQYIVVANSQTTLPVGFKQISINNLSDLPKAEKLGIIGGGDLNGRLAKIKAIDEIILDIESVHLKEGLRLFGKHDVKLKLKLLSSQKIGDNTIQKHYKVLK